MSAVAPAVSAEFSVCGKCRLKLPLRSPRTGETGEFWVCTGCDSHLQGVLLPSTDPEFYRNVRRVTSPLQNLPADGASSSSTRIREPRFATPVGVARSALRGRAHYECRLETRQSRVMDSLVSEPRNLLVHQEGPAFLKDVVSHAAMPYQEETLVALEDHRVHSLKQLESMVAALEKGHSPDVEMVEAITRDSLCKSVQDLDIFVRLGINPPVGEYPIQHSLHVAMLASSIGIQLGWDEKTIREVGVGCILHDLGMTRVPESTYQSDSIIDDRRFGEIARHPLHTFDILEDQLSSIPMIARMVAYQIHERSDGSGYPRKRRQPNIHPAARVAAIADVYVALVSPRPHRPALMPYHAVLHLLQGVREGSFDSLSVRYLLETISLFPLGSYVQLSDGRVGKVLRANKSHYDRPMVEAWKPDHLDTSPEIVDLLRGSSLTIVRALPTLNLAHVYPNEGDVLHN